MNVGSYIRVNVGLQSHLGGFEHRFHERIVVLLEDKGERDLESRYANIVFEHPALYQIFPRSGVTYMTQRVNHLLWIHAN